jgi:hypothetical protein
MNLPQVDWIQIDFFAVLQWLAPAAYGLLISHKKKGGEPA